MKLMQFMTFLKFQAAISQVLNHVSRNRSNKNVLQQRKWKYQVTPWTVHQAVVGLTQRERQPFMSHWHLPFDLQVKIQSFRAKMNTFTGLYL